MGIVHNSAKYMPDLLDHMAESYPNLTVKNGVMGRNSDIETTTMANYRDQVKLTAKAITILLNNMHYLYRCTNHMLEGLFVMAPYTRYLWWVQ
jgi:lysine-specific demethylase 9